ncbi:hypothetical protein N0V90_007856 [Kalmusia sp. IMI 367209]|nr:hypothetical protein N0V90_007856 [Kalmusia sp. IMI 367209]
MSGTSFARKALIGSPSNFWLHHTSIGFDLTHPSVPTAPSSDPNGSTSDPKLTIQTTTCPITISRAKSALVIIDMQNFFLSEAFGRQRGAGHAACDNLVTHAIPAARKAGMRIIWVNWGLTEDELQNMPPSVKRCFGFASIPADQPFSQDFSSGPNSIAADRFGAEKITTGPFAMYHGMGSDCGTVELEPGKILNAGRLLMRDSWNSALYPPLDTIYAAGAALPRNPDVWIHKNRMSGLWGSSTPLQAFLEKEGIRTLLFAGVNTDQCVGGTMTDAFSNGYDCVLLSDGCGTSSPEFAQESWEFNAARSYGFVASCEGVAEGVKRMFA